MRALVFSTLSLLFSTSASRASSIIEIHHFGALHSDAYSTYFALMCSLKDKKQSCRVSKWSKSRDESAQVDVDLALKEFELLKKVSFLPTAHVNSDEAALSWTISDAKFKKTGTVKALSPKKLNTQDTTIRHAIFGFESFVENNLHEEN